MLESTVAKGLGGDRKPAVRGIIVGIDRLLENEKGEAARSVENLVAGGTLF